ncbi:MAG TPA: hypothetical protein ENN68_01755, partial [Methanomicrobia archaeon]|nr:hypothetical protein [Methanomicrobia archaeon]
ICRRALADELEPADIPDKPLDVLAHQLAGLLLLKRRWNFDEAVTLFRKAYPYRDLEEDELIGVLSYMHARIPRLLWYSPEDRVFLRPQRIKPLYSYYFEHLSMIPEERHFLVIDEDDVPVGVLDEAFVAEYGSPGNKFIEGGRAWKILYVFGERLYVKQEEDPTGAIPSWAGEEIPVPYTIANEVGTIRRFVSEELSSAIGTPVGDLLALKRYPGSPETLTRALDEVARQVKSGYPVPSDEVLTLERGKDQIILQCAFGLRANRTLAMLLASVLSDRLGTPVGVQQDPYRIVLRIAEPGVELEEVRAVLLALAAGPIEPLAKSALVRSSLFKMRFIHVARRFGAIAPDAALTELDLAQVIGTFEDTAVFTEALREAEDKDVDVPLTAALLKRIHAGELQIAVLYGAELSPIGGIGASLKRGYELIPPERMHRVIHKYVSARLMDESLTFVCTACWQHIAILRVHDVDPAHLQCPDCESQRIGALNVDEGVLRRELRKRAAGTREKAGGKLVSDLTTSADLIARYGKAALLALAGRGLGADDAAELLKQESEENEHLVELIISAEKAVLKRRFHRSGWRTASRSQAQPLENAERIPEDARQQSDR